MGILLCEIFFRDVWIRNKSVRAEIGHILRTHTQTDTHTHSAKLVVRLIIYVFYIALNPCTVLSASQLKGVTFHH